MNKINKFIYTKNKETAVILKRNGFFVLNEQVDSWTFLNDLELPFPNNIDPKTLVYTNILSI